jgi:hypothetical protein
MIAIDIRLTVAAAFMITATIAAALHLYLYREAIKDRTAYVSKGLNGLGAEVSNGLVRTERIRLIVMTLLAVAGAGATFGLHPGWGPLRQAAWIIALLPAITMWGSIRDLQSRKRQVGLAEAMAAKLNDPAKPGE